MIVFVNLFTLDRLCTRIPLLNVCLKGGNLFVYVRYVLLNDKREFLSNAFSNTGKKASTKVRTLISTGLSSNSVLRFATGMVNRSMCG